MKQRIALIDGDVLVYQAGFASDAAAKSLKTEFEPLNYALHGTNELIQALLRNSEADDYRVFVSHPVNFREQFYPPYKTNRICSSVFMPSIGYLNCTVHRWPSV